MVKTLNDIVESLGEIGFKKYAHDYGNERIDIEAPVEDAIYILESYRDDERLIEHFSNFQDEMFNEYNSKGYVPFYKTDEFQKQCDDLRKQGFMATDFI